LKRDLKKNLRGRRVEERVEEKDHIEMPSGLVAALAFRRQGPLTAA
jgi:hypothetical protein